MERNWNMKWKLLLRVQGVGSMAAGQSMAGSVRHRMETVFIPGLRMHYVI